MPEDGLDRPDVLPVGQVKRRDRVPERVRPGVLEARAPDEAVPLVLEGAVRLGPDQLGDHGKAVERPDPHLAKPLALQLDGHPCPESPPLERAARPESAVGASIHWDHIEANCRLGATSCQVPCSRNTIP